MSSFENLGQESSWVPINALLAASLSRQPKRCSLVDGRGGGNP